jgi:hypothetical protein
MTNKISVFHDNPPLSGKKFFLISKVSPEGSQKNSVHGIKLHDVCETEEDGRLLCKYYHDLDPDFDVFLGTVGKWCPWMFETTEINAVYADNTLTNLISSHRELQKTTKSMWNSALEKDLAKIKEGSTVEGQQNLEEDSKKRRPVTLLFKIRQMESDIANKNKELSKFQDEFDAFSDEEKSIAFELESSFPLAVAS